MWAKAEPGCGAQKSGGVKFVRIASRGVWLRHPDFFTSGSHLARKNFESQGPQKTSYYICRYLQLQSYHPVEHSMELSWYSRDRSRESSIDREVLGVHVA